jgi:hypothetical protein
LDEELRGFLEMAAKEKMKEALSHKEGLRAVRLERGNLEVTREIIRCAGWESFVETCVGKDGSKASGTRRRITGEPEPAAAARRTAF